jgi:predicted AAA+ superfamily ATPase
MYNACMIDRGAHRRTVTALLRDFPVVAILGARQVGKSTLAMQIMASHRGPAERFDLEDPADLARLEDARLALSPLRGLVVLDEVQRRPDLFPVLRVLADRRPRLARFLVLGSASPELLRQTSETLAGRIAFHTLDGFDLSETGADTMDQLWLRGGFPGSFLARSEALSFAWRRHFIRTFVERDLALLGVRVAATTMSRFWAMLAHYHGQTFNASELGRAFGVTDKTVRHYLDVLSAALVVRQLLPFHANIGKRQVKAPKVYLRDSGLLHGLLDLRERRDLERHPKVGASWEGFLLQQVIQQLGAADGECYFWATHSGAELDLLWIRGRRRWGFEFKRTSAPAMTPSLNAAIESLELERAFVIHAGDRTFPLRERVTAVAAARLLTDLSRL